MPLPPDLVDRIRQLEAELVALRDYGLDLDKPGLAARLKEKKAEMAAKYAADRQLCDDINREITPRLVALYVEASEENRAALRALLKDCRQVCHALRRPKTLDAELELRTALALLAMKDGDPIDWRDEIMTLDALVKRGRDAGLDVARLMREGAALASDEPRGNQSSFRATLIRRALAFDQQSE